ncbi:MAG: hypothetical protein VKL39_13645 [Leptolyngbyaceae bacterium]|nr:hypothetical protein [Leptolyngbyaceae bacterium]
MKVIVLVKATPASEARGMPTEGYQLKAGDPGWTGFRIQESEFTRELTSGS